MYLYAKFHFIFYRQQIWNKTENHECFLVSASHISFDWCHHSRLYDNSENYTYLDLDITYTHLHTYIYIYTHTFFIILGGSEPMLDMIQHHHHESRVSTHVDQCVDAWWRDEGWTQREATRMPEIFVISSWLAVIFQWMSTNCNWIQVSFSSVVHSQEFQSLSATRTCSTLILKRFFISMMFRLLCCFHGNSSVVSGCGPLFFLCQFLCWGGSQDTHGSSALTFDFWLGNEPHQHSHLLHHLLQSCVLWKRRRTSVSMLVLLRNPNNNVSH